MTKVWSASSQGTTQNQKHTNCMTHWTTRWFSQEMWIFLKISLGMERMMNHQALQVKCHLWVNKMLMNSKTKEQIEEKASSPSHYRASLGMTECQCRVPVKTELVGNVAAVKILILHSPPCYQERPRVLGRYTKMKGMKIMIRVLILHYFLIVIQYILKKLSRRRNGVIPWMRR